MLLQGFFIANLAMEYHLLASNGLNTYQTRKDLYYAIEAINRVDYYAESYWGCSNELNGFFMRDDVPSNFFNDTYISQAVGDYLNESYVPPLDGYRLKCVLSGFTFYENPAEISQDQVVGLVVGLRFVKQFLPENETWNNAPFMDGETSFVKEVQAISLRMLEYFEDNSWTILNPCTGDCVQGTYQEANGNHDCIVLTTKNCTGAICDCGGAKINRLSYAVVKANCQLQPSSYIGQCTIDNDNQTVQDNKHSWTTIYKISHNYLTSILAAVTNIWGSETTAKKMAKRGINHNAEFLILIHQILYGVQYDNNNNPITVDDAYIECMLNAAPCRGIEGIGSPTNGYIGQNNFEWTRNNRLKESTFSSNWSDMFPGIDYMFFFNAYSIVHPNYLNGTYDLLSPFQVAPENVIKEKYTEYDKKNFIASSTVTGRQDYIISTDISEGTGRVNFIAGEEIALLPGFEVEEGATFSAFIDPSIAAMNCIEQVITDCSYLREGNYKMTPDSGNDNNQNAPMVVADNEQGEKGFDNDNLNTTSGISIHPNPTAGEFTIQVTGDAGQGKSEVYIYDIFGRLIYKSEIVNLPADRQGRQSEIVNISQHPKGIYLVKVLSGEKVYIKKLVHN